MVLVDTSVWINHFRQADAKLVHLLTTAQVFTHPFVIGELALGSLKQRPLFVATLQDLPHVPVALDAEVLAFIESAGLAESGIGYVDAHLLASARLAGIVVWTEDKRLVEVEARHYFSAQPKTLSILDTNSGNV
jgi:predicted nucleic acid-binding protein